MQQENPMGKRGEMPLYERENELLARVWARVSPPVSGIRQIKPERNANHQLHDWAAQMMTFLEGEFASVRYYQKMARQYPGRSMVFSTLAEEEMRHAKKLAAELFLRGGIRLSETPPNHPVAVPEYCSALRARILSEQQGEVSYRKAAKEAPDRALHQLYLTLAEEEHRHREMLYQMLEHAI